MADRYWVGGTASWDGTAGTKWALTSGGAGGQAVPTSADDVFFDAASGANTVTIAAGNTGAKSINCTGFTGTLAGTTAITVSGSVTLVAGMTVTYTGTLTLAGTGTLTSAGKTLGPVTISGSAITVTLGDALNIGANALTITQGTFTTSGSNYSITAGSISSSNSNTRTINLNGSTVTLSAAAAVALNTNTNLTFTAGTSTITCSATSVTLNGGATTGTGVTFYNVAFTTTAVSTHNIQSINTFNNFAVTAPASAGVTQVTFDSRQTINGTLSTTGTAGNRRVWFRGVTYGLAQTLTVNSTPSLTDADFRDLYIIGTASPISGTRIGDLRGCSGITFSTPKTVYWNLAGAQNWSADGWSDTSTGTPSTDFFPLAQDTATFTNAGSVTGTITMNSAIPYTGTVDMSGRTSAMTLSQGAAQTIYGDWKNGSGTTLGGTANITFSGRNTQNIICAGKYFESNITIDSYGGTVQLQDAFLHAALTGALALTITNGKLVTNGYNVFNGRAQGAGAVNVNSVFAELNCGASVISYGRLVLTAGTVNAGSCTFNIANNSNIPNFAGASVAITDCVFNAGTSKIAFPYNGVTQGINASIYTSKAIQFNNVDVTTPNPGGLFIDAPGSTFNEIKSTARTANGYTVVSFSNNCTVNSFNLSSTASTYRHFVYSSVIGTQRTITVQSAGTLTNVDFRGITITGAAAPLTGTSIGNALGNSGITFTTPKTVYWNLSGTQNWSATAWASGSGGAPDINNFPLPQDTAVFDNTGSAGTVTFDVGWNVGTVDASARTTAMTLSTSTLIPFVYGDWKFGTGVTSSSTTGALTFAKSGTQTITSNGVTFGCPVTINSATGTVQLADALTIEAAKTLTLTTGTFDAVTFNATVGLFAATGGTLKMGTGTWTLSGTGTVWSGAMTNLYIGTANIVLSNTSTTARTFAGGNFSYNKLTIGGTTGTSTLTITGNNQFTELASTKTVAHTIALGTTAQTFGKWTVTGTVGNVVTLTGTGTSHVLAGACTSGIDYLAMGSIGFAATSPGEFYAGANSTATAAVAPVYLTAKPADSTRYWVGGTGNWSDTARWSTGSGGASGASVPRSHDDVVFDSASNATDYTATINAVTGGIRMKSLTVAGPASGNLTLAGTETVFIHNNVTLPATGLTRTYTGAITLSGSTTGRTLTTNGVALASAVTVNGVGCEWTLGSALNIGSSTLTATNGIFKASTYNITAAAIASDNGNIRTVDFGSSTLTLSGTAPINFGTTELNRASLTVTAGTSQINCSSNTPTFTGNNQTFYNVAFTGFGITLNGTNVFNNLSVNNPSGSDSWTTSIAANQTINGTLSCVAGPDARARMWFLSNVIGTTRTLTCAAVSLIDADFSDIQIAGAAAPASGTRLGDAQGNSGITFTTPKTVYWNLPAGGNWRTSIPWALTSGGAPSANNFPLPQDTAIIEATGLNSGTTITMSISATNLYPSIDLSARTTNTVTISWPNNFFYMFGNITLASGVTYAGGASSGNMYFYKRNGTQELTSAGKTIVHQAIFVANRNGTLLLKDAASFNFTTAFNFGHSAGTIDINGYSFTIGGNNTASFAGQGINFGTNGQLISTTNLAFGAQTFSGSGTISMTGAGAKSFAGGGNNFGDVAINQGGAGTLTITGNNTFKDITNTYKSTGAATIALGNTIQSVSAFTAAGEASRALTITGTSAASPATLVYTGASTISSDYLTITGVRAYPTSTTWYAGANSINNGSLGWTFTAAPPSTVTYNFFLLFN